MKQKEVDETQFNQQSISQKPETNILELEK